MIKIGLLLGGLLSKNVFMPLNSVNWLNQHWYKNNPRVDPILSDQTMLQILSIVSLIFGLYIHFTVPESMTDTPSPSICDVVKMFPKFFRNEWIRKFILVLFFAKFFLAVMREPVSLKFI